VQEQAVEFLKSATCCKGCGQKHATKSTRALVYRTAFGKTSLRSPQLYSRCAHCKLSASENATFDPLAFALPERTHPQWTWLQCRFASVMSYRLAQIFLRDAFPGGRALGASTLKATVRTIGERLEQEIQHGIQSTAAACRGQGLPTPARDAPADVALQIDAGYIRSTPTSDGTRWFAAVASKIVHADLGRNLAHAYSIGYDPWGGLRQQAFLGTAGIALSQPAAVLSDGGEDIAWACK
jgi:hypothetical protein